jgi:hypothetical protein
MVSGLFYLPPTPEPNSLIWLIKEILLQPANHHVKVTWNLTPPDINRIGQYRNGGPGFTHGIMTRHCGIA